eukprot:TRINITY_DN894_c0_g1_i2.p1 TRINITY_DN894_c0_g1~~TRINITY_DN894_c0_g1_i2.p1  ORF type:complete len:528 (-),score=69.68 TRINITY_DN894_c0_g1_i2:301-1884(-)
MYACNSIPSSISLHLPSHNGHFLLKSSNSLRRLGLSGGQSAASPFKARRLHLKSFSYVKGSVAKGHPEVNAEEGDDEAKTEEKFDWFSHWYLSLVVWWDRHGEQWLVFDDKCPHRLAPLSEGRIAEDGTLQCCYHGWCFGPEGNCTYIPQLPPDGPPAHSSKRACVSAYPSLSQQGIVWFWPNTSAEFRSILSERKPPLIPGLSDPSFQSHFPSMRDLPYGYEILTENLMDPSHVPYAHYGLMGQTGSPRLAQNHQRAGRPIDMKLQRLDQSGFEATVPRGSWNFIAPCLIVGTLVLDQFEKEEGQSSKTNKQDGKTKTLYFVFLCVPVSAGKSRILWAFPRNFAHWVDFFLRRWIVHINQILFLDSDLCMLHIEEKLLLKEGMKTWEKACYVPTSADTAVIAFRKWLKKYAEGGIYWGEKATDFLCSTLPKEQAMDRYWSHVVKCRSCRGALKLLKALETSTQILSIVFIGFISILGATKWISSNSLVLNTSLLTASMLCCILSRWLSNFIYKTYYFHDYNHAFVK